MAKAKVKPIHLTVMKYAGCVAACDSWLVVIPTDKNIIKIRTHSSYSKGTFDPTKVTCKRCLKHEDYKTAMDKIKYPLFFLKEDG